MDAPNFPPLPDAETRRLEVLHQCCGLETADEDAYDDISRLAAYICDTPFAAISLIDEQRQWFKSIIGLDLIGLDIQQTPREVAFCAHTILQQSLMVIPDAQNDPRFADNPLVTGDPNIRFYAGAPLVTEDGFALGSLCVFDTVLRRLTAQQEMALRLLARQVTHQLETTRRTAAQERLVAEREQTDLERRRLADIVESSDDGIASIDLDGLITSWNKSLARATGLTAKEAVGQHISILASPDQVTLIAENNERMRRGEVIEPTEIETQTADGSKAYVMLTVSPIWDGAGNLVGSSSITRDITERKQDENARKRGQEEACQNEARLAEAQRIARIGSWELEVATGRLTWSAEMFRLLEFDPAQGEPSDEAFLRRFHPDDLPARTHAFAEALATGHLYQMDVRVLLPSGAMLWCRSAGQPVLDKGGAAVRVVGTLMDITERKEAEQRLQGYAVVLEFQKKEMEKANAELAALATTDGLTGLKNHRVFQERLAEEVSRAARYGTPLSLILLDVDRFKLYNDAHGHPAGDGVLRGVARLLRQVARETDLVARYGGEEFALILPQTDGGEAALVAERIRRAIEAAPWPLQAVTASLGVAMLIVVHESLIQESLMLDDRSSLVTRADAALYRSKADGRNRVTHGTVPALVPIHVLP